MYRASNPARWHAANAVADEQKRRTASATAKPTPPQHRHVTTPTPNANPNDLIGALPGELQNLSFSRLSTRSRIHLAATNHYYERVISVSKEDRVALLLSVERGNMHGCTLCVRLLPLEAFGCTQTFKKRDHGGAMAAMRFCIRCGLARRTYTRGNSVRAYFEDGAVINGVTFAAPYEAGSATDWFKEYGKRRGFSLSRPPPRPPPSSDRLDFDDQEVLDIVFPPSPDEDAIIQPIRPTCI